MYFNGKKLPTDPKTRARHAVEWRLLRKKNHANALAAWREYAEYVLHIKMLLDQ